LKITRRVAAATPTADLIPIIRGLFDKASP
jgi:hypothetical protein